MLLQAEVVRSVGCRAVQHHFQERYALFFTKNYSDIETVGIEVEADAGVVIYNPTTRENLFFLRVRGGVDAEQCKARVLRVMGERIERARPVLVSQCSVSLERMIEVVRGFHGTHLTYGDAEYDCVCNRIVNHCLMRSIQRLAQLKHKVLDREIRAAELKRLREKKRVKFDPEDVQSELDCELECRLTRMRVC